MILNKCRNEKVGMIVSLPHVQGNRLVAGFCRLDEVFGQELIVRWIQEFIVGTLID